MQNTKQHKLSAAQICGWIVWWVITIVVLALAIFMLTRTTDAAGVNNSWNYHMIAIFLLLVYGIQQIIAFFGIKRLHYNERRVADCFNRAGRLGQFLVRDSRNLGINC